MILIADSGATKTAWALADGGGSVSFLTTEGISPVYQDGDSIRSILEPVREWSGGAVSQVWFYGSGVRGAFARVLQDALCSMFPGAAVTAESDLLGAARGLCGHREGVACILGTGSNSCLFDGSNIVANTPSLGFILGDEGSGAALGKAFLNALLKGRLDSSLQARFLLDTGLTVDDVITKVYRSPLPSRFLASMSRLVAEYKKEWPELNQLVINNFRSFFRVNILPYDRCDLPVSVLGGMAFHYADELRQAARLEGFTIGIIAPDAIKLLAAYHQE